MNKVALTLATGDYDHVRDLFDGTVRVEGVDLTILRYQVEEMFYRFMTQREWDVSEMSFAKCVALIASGDRSLVPIPVFVSRAFRHSSIYLRADSTLTKMEDLRGKRVGVPEWAQTAAVYTRGMLHHHYGVDLTSIDWVQAGVNMAGRKEKIPLDLPAGFKLKVEPERSLTDMLLAGELDAVMSARPPTPYTDNDGRIKRLVGDARTADLAYWRDTGIFPIMHVVVLRRDVYEKHRWLAANLVSAFDAAKNRSLERASDVTLSMFPLPWLADYSQLSRSFMGDDFWPYGIDKNLATLQAFFDYAHEQGVAAKRLEPKDFFAPETLSKFKV
ncbi:MAG: 4,5-dihydroxyphthalate decarboxylase [Mucilaginibacter sp.]|nr:4,5-dihydroxyphthalate decarboxylase [Mucilaginibacter sp.]